MISSRVINSYFHTEWCIYTEFEKFGDFKELIEDLLSASEGDVFTLKISSGGGRVDVAMAVIKAIKCCKGKVIARVVHASASMAAVLACACHALIIEEHAYLMFHSYSSGVRGKSDEMIQSLREDDISIKGEMESIVTPFLTKMELKRIHSGKDLYIRWNSRGLDKRLLRHFKAMQEAEVTDDNTNG